MQRRYSEPPRSFTFEYVDKDGQYHIERNHTPQSFFEAYIGSALKDTVSIINAPTDDKPNYRTYTVSMLGNVVGGEKVYYLNLPIDEFKALIIHQPARRAGLVPKRDCRRADAAVRGHLGHRRV